MTNSLVLPNDEELACWLAFDQMPCKGLGGRKLKALYQHFDSLIPAWSAGRNELIRVPGLPHDVIERLIEARRAVEPERLLEQCRQADVEPIPWCNPKYPARLKEIHDPPAILYIKGRFELDDLNRAAGVVGTRSPTDYGQKLSKEISRSLAQSGVTIISGMAYGVDSFAHRGAIEGGGKTFAVVGCGPDICYPSSNKPLFNLLASGKNGAVISEFFPGTKVEPWRFPARNRIISGLSQALIVVEAGENSGSLITARLAFEQNREVFAVPGRIDSPSSAGSNELIARNMAHLMRSYKDVIEEMNWGGVAKTEESSGGTLELYGREKDVSDLLSNEPTHFDVLCERSGLAAGELSAVLTMLELGGVVTRHPGDWYSK
jgi:DNA processing protein